MTKNIEDLTDEIILMIFYYLGQKELIDCTDVSKKFKRLSLDNTLWSHFRLEPGCYKGSLETYPMDCILYHHIGNELIAKLIQRGCKFLDVSICRKRPQVVDEKSLPRRINLIGLKLSYTQYSDEIENPTIQMFVDLINPCSSLKKLAIIGKFNKQFNKRVYTTLR